MFLCVELGPILARVVARRVERARARSRRRAATSASGSDGPPLPGGFAEVSYWLPIQTAASVALLLCSPYLSCEIGLER